MNDIKKVSVIGAGTMGHGIAQISAMAGYTVTLVDQNDDILASARHQIERNLQKGVERKKISEEQQARALDHIACDTTLHAAAKSDLVIEAIHENLDNKIKLLQSLEPLLSDSAVLASNTSSLSVTKMAESVKRSENVVGLHFFNPVHIMKLIEVVLTKHTCDEAQDRSRAFAKSLNKDAIYVWDSPGFATSRLGISFALEAMRMVESGVASVRDIDKAMVLGYGHPMGPLELTDLVGLDVRLAISETLCQELENQAFEPPKILRHLVASGNLGKKTGQGFYTWQDGVIKSD